MKLIFADSDTPQTIIQSIFLAGPSPRDKKAVEWRHDAVSYLESINFNGHVFIPVPEKRFYGQDESKDWTYDGQVEWECKFRHIADLIIFWVPRNISEGMPAFTTNIEFGEDVGSGKIVYGRPDGAEKCKYLDKRIKDKNLPIFNNLKTMLEDAIFQMNGGSVRTLGEIYVPLFIWNTKQFKSWYQNLKLAGNTLECAKLLHHTEFSNKKVFCYILWVNVWVEKEKRFKENEFVFSRTDISSVVAYYENEIDVEVLLVREFRSPVNNPQGFVYELPGGSSVDEGIDAKTNAQHELSEETGLFIDDLSRFKYVGQRQLMSTLSSHQAQVYCVKLQKIEYEQIKENIDKNTCFGLPGDSEKTYVNLVKVSQLKNSFLDYSMIGMIYEAIFLK